MVSVKMDMDKSKAIDFVVKLESQVLQTANNSAETLGKLGKNYARTIAPYYSGKTFRNIVLMRNRNELTATIVAKNPTANDGHKRNIKQFNLVRWMHDSPRAALHIKSGDRQFMYTTKEYLESIAGNTVQGEFNKINIR